MRVFSFITNNTRSEPGCASQRFDHEEDRRRETRSGRQWWVVTAAQWREDGNVSHPDRHLRSRRETIFRKLTSQRSIGVARPQDAPTGYPPIGQSAAKECPRFEPTIGRRPWSSTFN